MTDPTTTTTLIKIAPLPGADVEEIEATPRLAEYVAACQPGEPCAAVLYGRIFRPESGKPVPALVRGYVFDGILHGDTAEVSADHVKMIAAGIAVDPGRRLADLGVDFIPARMATLADEDDEA